ncbi:MAG: hypothetical protein U0L92_01025 [Clostridia bacterium]|nr:hypothetical protein [Clostridia bacterium]
MPNTYRGRDRKREKTEPPPSSGLLRRFGQLLLKQTAAVLICTALVWGMQNMDSPRINSYADALGRALRHESNLTSLAQSGAELKSRIIDLFSPNEVTEQ